MSKFCSEMKIFTLKTNIPFDARDGFYTLKTRPGGMQEY